VHHPRTSLLCVENTHNLHGGVVVPLEALRSVKRLGEERGLPVHMDGARLWNAAAAGGASLEAYAACADTVMVSLSKGLGCPVGSMLAGTREVIDAAWRERKRLGGGMRQIGILAAAGLWALDHHLDRLPEDHARARRLAEGCAQIEGLRPDEPETNILMIHVEDPAPGPEALSRRLEELGVLISPEGPGRLRAVTHLDVDDAGIERALEALRVAVAGPR
jgi:threonine aldolase